MVAGARKAIEAGEFLSFKEEFLGNYLSSPQNTSAPRKKKGKNK